MSLSGLLGNAELKKRLCADIQSDRLSHCYLLCGPDGSGKHTLAALLAAAMECTQPDAPCLRCAQCRKVMEGVHPDVITVEETDKGKKTVSVGLARQAREDLFIRPGEGKRKVYLFPRAQDMTPQAQNALLKALEEPPSYGAFLLLADRAEAMLPTVRSRCVLLQLLPVPEQEAFLLLRTRFPDRDDAALRRALRLGGGWIGQAEAALREELRRDPLAEELCEHFEKQDALQLTQTLGKLERRKREQLLPVLRQAYETFAAALIGKTDALPGSSRTAVDLARACRALREAIRAAEANVGVGHICGYLAVKLR